MLDSIKNLSFDFSKSLHTPRFKQDLALKRLQFHSMNESVIYQVRFLVNSLLQTREIAKSKVNEKNQDVIETAVSSMDSMALDTTADEKKLAGRLSLVRTFRLGILLPDIFPDTSETFTFSLVDAISSLVTLDQIEIISRRADLDTLQFPPKYNKVKSSWNFTDPKYMAQFDMVVIICIPLYAPMLEELLKNQQCPLTIMFPTMFGLTYQRLSNILKSDMILQPEFKILDEQMFSNAKQDVILKQDTLPIGPVTSNLGIYDRFN